LGALFVIGSEECPELLLGIASIEELGGVPQLSPQGLDHPLHLATASRMIRLPTM
jgi:hypothetical protein